MTKSMRDYRLLLVLLGCLGLLSLISNAVHAGVYWGAGPNAANEKSSLGINLGEPQSYQPDYLFVDAVLKGRKWIAHGCEGSNWDTGKALGTDSNGWITRVPEGICPGLVVLDAPGTLLGTYVLIWEGEGTLSAQIGPAAGLKCGSPNCRPSGYGGMQARSIGAGPHRATFELKTAATTVTDLRIMAFNSARPIKNIRVIVPGGLPGKSATNLNYKAYCKTARGPEGSAATEALSKPGADETCYDFEQIYWDRFRDPLDKIQHPKVLLHPLTLAGLQGFRLVRAMDWMHTNGSPIQSWSQRSNYKHANQTESVHGVAFEYLVALANAGGMDLWVNIPHLADDDYVNAFAAFLRDNLHPGLAVYVEYSNELWNDFFAQSGWLLQEGQRRRLSADNPWEGRLRCHSERAVTIADTFKRVFAGQTQRVVNVVAGQAANPDTGRQILEWKNAKTHFDAYAIAPYFGNLLGENAAVSGYSLDQVFQKLSSDAISNSRSWIKNSATMLKQINATNVRLVNYEAGPHLAGVGELQNDERMTNLFTGANRDPRMRSVMNDYLKMLRSEGANEICYFNYVGTFGKYGSWGARELETDQDAPKWRALQAFMQSDACWWNGCGRSSQVRASGDRPRDVPTRVTETPSRKSAQVKRSAGKSNPRAQQVKPRKLRSDRTAR
jgi:hypothetical protein